LLPSKLVNQARGEVLASLGGQNVRLCVTLRALAQLEAHFEVAGLEALGARLARLNAEDMFCVLEALQCDGGDLKAMPITFHEALRAIVAAFDAMGDGL